MRKLLLLVSFFGPAMGLFAQQFSGALNFSPSIPVSNFREASGKLVLPELNFHGIYCLPSHPIGIGLNIGYSRYGSKLDKRDDIWDDQTDDVRVRRNNNLVNAMATIRFTPELSLPFQPYIEGGIGALYAYTYVNIRESIFEEPIFSDTELYNWTLAYQGTGGILWPIDKNNQLFLEFRLNYRITPNKVEYLLKQDAEYDLQDGLLLDPRRSTLDMLQPGVGILFYLE